MLWKWLTPWIIAGAAVLALVLTIWITNTISAQNFRNENQATYHRAYVDATTAAETRFSAAIAEHNVAIETMINNLNARSAASDAALRQSQQRLTVSTQALLTHIQEAYPDATNVPPSTQELLRNSFNRWEPRNPQVGPANTPTPTPTQPTSTPGATTPTP